MMKSCTCMYGKQQNFPHEKFTQIMLKYTIQFIYSESNIAYRIQHIYKQTLVYTLCTVQHKRVSYQVERRKTEISERIRVCETRHQSTPPPPPNHLLSPIRSLFNLQKIIIIIIIIKHLYNVHEHLQYLLSIMNKISCQMSVFILIFATL